MSEFDFKKHPFIPLYGDQPIPFFNEEYSKQSVRTFKMNKDYYKGVQ